MELPRFPGNPWVKTGSMEDVTGRIKEWEKDSTLGSLNGLTTIIDCFLMSLMILLPLEIVK
jgi:hypothetical protein